MTSLHAVNESDVELAFDFIANAAELSNSKTAARIVKDIAGDTLLHGRCEVSHKEFGRRTGKCRRTVDHALKRLMRLGLIERVNQVNGRSTYRAVLGGTYYEQA